MLKVALVSFVILAICGTSLVVGQDWDSTNTFTAIAQGDEELYLETIQQSSTTGGVENSQYTSLDATGVFDIYFNSQSVLTNYGEDGSITTTSNGITQRLTLPKAFDISMSQGQEIYGTSTDYNAMTDIGSLFQIGSSGDDSVDEIINNAMSSYFGSGLTIGELKELSGMQYSVSPTEKQSHSVNGVTCTMNGAKNTAVTMEV